MTARRLLPFLTVLCAIVVLRAAPLASQETPVAGPAALLRAPAFRNLGPARQNGRILHVLVNERQPSTYYLAPATGGLWKTVNNGTSFESVLPDRSAVSIGHAALAPSNPDIVWVGTGDAASGRIPLRGFGVWKSMDAGKTWAHMGLTETRHIGRIAVHPRNPDIVYVPNVSFYRSQDGGKTWGKKGPENLARSFHVDYHGFWVDPRDSKHLILASDGGLAVSWDFGETWDVVDHLPLAQYYAIGVDMEQPYNIYGGL